MLATGNETIYYENIPMTSDDILYASICILHHAGVEDGTGETGDD